MDAAELAHVGINYLREHIISQARVSYGYEYAGFPGPGIVQDYCKVHYSVKAPTYEQADYIYNRVLKIIQGSNLMTETTSEVTKDSVYKDYISNQVLSKTLYDVMVQVPEVVLDEKEKELIHELFITFNDATKRNAKEFFFNLGLGSHYLPDDSEFWSGIVPYVPGINMGGSTDVGDVSKIVPCAQMNCTISPIGTPAHSWQMCSCAGSSLGLKGTMFAAKSLCGTALKAILNPEIIKKAKEEYSRVFGK